MAVSRGGQGAGSRSEGSSPERRGTQSNQIRLALADYFTLLAQQQLHSVSDARRSTANTLTSYYLRRGPPTRTARNDDGRAVRPDPPDPLRHRGEPVRRARRGDQHHAADPAAAGRRGDPPRAQPLGRRGGHGRDPGGRARRRHQLVPGRARRVLQLPRRPAARARRGAREGLRRRRGRHRPGRDRPPARPRRRAHLLPHRRPAPGPAGDDQHDDPDLRRRPRRAAPVELGRRLRRRAGHARAGPLGGRGRAAARRDPRARRPRRSRAGPSRCSASPAPAARASRR